MGRGHEPGLRDVLETLAVHPAELPHRRDSRAQGLSQLLERACSIFERVFGPSPEQLQQRIVIISMISICI